VAHYGDISDVAWWHVWMVACVRDIAVERRSTESLDHVGDMGHCELVT
jgi:hypothetical protein